MVGEFVSVYGEKIAGFNESFKNKALASFEQRIRCVVEATSHITDIKQRITAILSISELPKVFQYEDHFSMFSGIEARVPLANPELVKIADLISPLLQLKTNKSGRYFLRKVLEKVGLPNKIVNRDKFPTPKKQNYVGQLIKILEENRELITNSKLVQQVYSTATLDLVLNPQNINTSNVDTGVNISHRYGNIEDILLNIIGLWQFRGLF